MRRMAKGRPGTASRIKSGSRIKNLDSSKHERARCSYFLASSRCFMKELSCLLDFPPDGSLSRRLWPSSARPLSLSVLVPFIRFWLSRAVITDKVCGSSSIIRTTRRIVCRRRSSIPSPRLRLQKGWSRVGDWPSRATRRLRARSTASGETSHFEATSWSMHDALAGDRFCSSEGGTGGGDGGGTEGKASGFRWMEDEVGPKPKLHSEPGLGPKPEDSIGDGAPGKYGVVTRLVGRRTEEDCGDLGSK
mmetsp:Transcript_19130/g.34618  ORF Transcript_19130/g.34618 Transcript_19130/m.34618 type:complete len:248 (-) Transcript_19130:396-1139(-)